VRRLRAGELVVIPTETVYGLAADAENAEAVAAIFALKARPSNRPVIVHIGGAEALDAWAREVPDYARALAQALWPGPLTLVLPRTSRVPDVVTGGQDTVALRVPAHPVARALLAQFGGGLAAPSANPYGRISPTEPAHVRAAFGAATPLLLEGGVCTGGIESTIVSCLGPLPQVLRPGLITAAQIAAITGLTVLEAPEAPGAEPSSSSAAVRTAGQDRVHYAPRTAALLLARAELADWRVPVGKRIGFLGFAPAEFPVALSLRLPSDPAGAAQQLYSALHRLDQAGLDLVVIEAPPADAAWAGVRDRLLRATAGAR
jgi:L-threonylcarbamoyladenylate synthase